ncbi:MAG: chitobiase/beta-hexosaminidase C-terminal domain-containing protein [Syntrophomonas sp.]
MPIHNVIAADSPTIYETTAAEEKGISADEQHGLGTVPGRIDFNYSKPKLYRAFSAQSTLPAKYDLRDYNKLPPVRNQGQYGACWAFGALGSLESCLLPTEVCDFSENNLSNNRVEDDTEKQGGDIWDAIAYLTRWAGPVDESQDPYVIPHQSSPPSLSSIKHVQDVLLLPNRNDWADNDAIKSAIMQYGAVCSDFFWDTSYYSSYFTSYNYRYTSETNHMIDIVGWDDNYPNTNFINTPPSNGAFLCRNSWGTDWGDQGYFWISYCDATLANSNNNAVFFNAEPINNYDDIYQYDPLGMISRYGYGNIPTWGANVFQAKNDLIVSAVSTYIIGTGTIDVYVYRNAGTSPTKGALLCSESVAIDWAGYHTISLDSPALVAAGEKFSIVIKYDLALNDCPIPVEADWLSGVSPTANPGESYISRDGDDWKDMTVLYPETNVCIKAFTKAATESNKPITIQSISAVDGTVTVGLSGTPAVAPQFGDFQIFQSINNAVASTVTPSSINIDGTTVTLTIPKVSPTTTEQSVVEMVSYQCGIPVAADAFTIPAYIPPKAEAPVAAPVEGTVAIGTEIHLSTSTTGATIYYTTDGSTPTVQSMVYSDSSPIIINSNTTIQAIAAAPNMTNSDVMSATYAVQKAAAPAANPQPGAVPAGTAIVLSSDTESATIYYTTDGSDPTMFSAVYSEPIIINSAIVIKAMAVKSGIINSEIVTAAYSILIPNTIIDNNWLLDKNYEVGADLIVNHGEVNLCGHQLTVRGNINCSGSINLNHGQLNVSGNLNVSNGTVDLNGGQLNVYGDLIQSGGDTYINNGCLNANANYYIQGEVTAQDGKVTYGDCWARLFMTNQGDQINVGKNFRMASLYNHSRYLTAGSIYIKGDFIQGFAGTYSNFAANGSHTVTLSGTGIQSISFDTPDYSHFNNLVNNNSGTINFLTQSHYLDQLTGNTSNIENLQNITYSLNQSIAAPTTSVLAGEVAAGSTVTLTSSTEGAVIYYTTDGSMPTIYSIKYTGPIAIESTTTVKAVAALGIDDYSDVMTATYTIKNNADECFIATAAFGSKFQPAVVLLRHFRDQYLLTNTLGTAFVDFYYKHSPPIAAFIANSEPLKALVRILLLPLIALAYSIMHPVVGIGCLGVIVLIYLLRKNRNDNNCLTID